MSQFMPRSRTWLVASVLLCATPAVAVAKKAGCAVLKAKGECRKRSDCSWKAGACARAGKTLAKAKGAPSSAAPGARSAPNKAPITEDPAADNAAGDEDF